MVDIALMTGDISPHGQLSHLNPIGILIIFKYETITVVSSEDLSNSLLWHFDSVISEQIIELRTASVWCIALVRIGAEELVFSLFAVCQIENHIQKHRWNDLGPILLV